MCAGVCLEDAEFRIIGLDSNVLPLDKAPDDEVAKRTTCVFHSWIKDWQDEAVRPKGCPIKEQKILSKYGRSLWLDPNHEVVFRNHPVKLSFQKKRGVNSFELFGCMDGCDEGVKDKDQVDMWEECLCNCAIDQIVEYYQLHPEEEVTVHKKGEIPESGEGGGDEDEDEDEDEGIGMICRLLCS